MESQAREERSFSVDYGVRSDDPLRHLIHELVVTPYTPYRSKRVVYRVEQYRVGPDGKIHLVLIAEQAIIDPMSPADPARYLYQQGGSFAKDMR